MDLSQPVIAGHSFGSATVLRTLAVEKRFKYQVVDLLFEKLNI
jgi:hypothetical protein